MRLHRSLAISIMLALCAASAFAGAPDWFRHAAAESLPAYPPDTNAVVLLHEGRTTVKDGGEIRGNFRKVFKILRPQGRDVATVVLCSSAETRITYLKAWGLTAQGVEYEVKEKDAIETQIGGGELYSDDTCKVLKIPGGDPGGVVGYEYEQKMHPYLLEDDWWFQESEHPVRRSRLVLQLPSGWEHKVFWLNHAPVPPADLGGNQWSFELTDLPGIETEVSMPPMRAVVPRLGIQYFPTRGSGQHSWNDIAVWASGLINGRRQPTPAMQMKVAELTAHATSPLDKMRALAGYVQREVRYVAIEIGIGGYQPHFAGDVFANRWGDCKDKAALLSTMLRVAGIESDLVLVNTRRGVVKPEHPFNSFNHAILAIHVPAASAPELLAVADVPGVGRVLFFDPTDGTMQFGNLPGNEQSNYGLLVTEKGGVLVKLPVVAPEQNRIERYATMSLAPAGGVLVGQVREEYSGSEAADRRSEFMHLDPAQRKKRIESYLSNFLPSSDVTAFDVKNVDQLNLPLTLTYSFIAQGYSKTAGNLLLVRPRVLGEKGDDRFENQHKRERRYPVEFDNLSLQSDHVEITLPAGYSVDEIPDPVSLDAGAVSYVSRVTMKDNVIHYDREYRIKDVSVGTEKLQELKKFYRQVAGEEQNSVVLKKQ